MQTNFIKNTKKSFHKSKRDVVSKRVYLLLLYIAFLFPYLFLNLFIMNKI